MAEGVPNIVETTADIAFSKKEMEGGDSIVLEEEIDPNYEPTEKEVLEYATWLGMDLEAERDLFWIAREGLKAPLPANWKPCKTTDTEEIYYFNFASGQSTWDHPCDEFYRNLYEEHKKKLHGQGAQERDEKKKKAQADVAELLGRKNGGKKKKAPFTQAELLGGPSVGLSNVFEKKPLPGVTSRLGSVTGGGLKPVAGLGPLRSEAKESRGFGFQLDGKIENLKTNESVKVLSRTALGNPLTKKPQLTSSSTITTKAEETIKNDDDVFDEKRKKVDQDYAEMVRKVEDTHASNLDALRKKLKVEFEDVQDAEEMKLKYLKRELDKKKNAMENQFDQEENALKRIHNDRLKRLEADNENIIRYKKEELDRDSKAEIDKSRSRHEAKQREIQENFEQKERHLQSKMKADFEKIEEATQLVTELKLKIEQLHDQQKTLELDLKTAYSEKQAILQDKVNAENERDKAQCEVYNLQKQLSETSCRADPFHESCSKCLELEEKNAHLYGKCIEAQSQVEKLQKELSKLQEDYDSAKKAHADLDLDFCNREAASKEEIAALLEKVSILEMESSTLRSNGATLQSKIDLMGRSYDILTSERETTQLETLQEQLAASQAEAANTKITLQNLQFQHAETLTRNLQIEKLLTEPANEKNELCKQLESNIEEDAKASKYQQNLQALQQQLDNEIRLRQGLEESCNALQNEISALVQIKCILETKVERYNRLHDSITSTDEKAGLLDLQVEDGPRQKAQSTLNEESESLRAGIELLMFEKDASIGQNRQRQQEIDELASHLDRCNGREKDECKQCFVYEARVISLQNEKSDYILELKTVRTEISELQNGMTAERERFVKTITNLQRERDIAAAKFQDQETLLKHEVTELQRKLSLLEASQTSLIDNCHTATIDVAGKYESDLSSSESEAQKQYLEHQPSASNVEIASAKSELYHLRTDHQNLSLTNAETEGKLAKGSDEIKNLCKQPNIMIEEDTQRFADTTNIYQEQVYKLQQQLDEESRCSREKEKECDTLRNELHTVEQAKLKVDAQLDQLKSDKRYLESEMATLVLRLDNVNVLRKREKSVMSVENSLAEKRIQVEQLQASLDLMKVDNKHLNSRVKALTQDFEQVQTKLHRLETEYDKEHAISQSLEHERDTTLQRQRVLVDELEDCQCKHRELLIEISELHNQLNNAKSSEQAALSNENQIAQKLLQLEQQFECTKNALKMKLGQTEVQFNSSLRAKEQAELQIKVKENELAKFSHEATRRENELQTLQARIKSLQSDKDELHAALLAANIADRATAFANSDSAKLGSADRDAMLVKLQLAHANETELKAHLADVLIQLETSTRQCGTLEARCRDQGTEIESLHEEVTSLRLVSQKMHSSALETLTLVERLEYEHKKRILRNDFLIQLQDFQQREQQAHVRHKARIRAKYERQIDDMIAELEKTRRQRVEQEEMLSVQMLQQIRHETDIKRNEAKKQMRAELLQLEEELHQRKAREFEIITKAFDKEEDDLSTKLRDIRQVKREETFVEQRNSLLEDNAEGKLLQNHPSPASMRQLKKRQNDSDGNDSVLMPSSAQIIKKPNRRHNYRAKMYQKWKQRLKEEENALLTARNLVFNQRDGLAKQAQQLKTSKVEWKRTSRVSEANLVNREVKRMFDENMSNLSEGMRKLREQEGWVKQRELTVAKMKRMVNRLRQGSMHDNNLSGTSSDDDQDEFCNEWSDYSSPNEPLTSTLVRLGRLEEKLVSGAYHSSERAPKIIIDDLNTVYQTPQSYIASDGTYRYPSLKYCTANRARRISAGPERRWIDLQRGSGLRGYCFEPDSTARSAAHAELIFNQNISRWAKGREKVKRAATNHATWLSRLCDELNEYGAKYTQTMVESKDVSNDFALHKSEGRDTDK
ncbi:putative WW domain-containing protein [Plasmopara halstedii]